MRARAVLDASAALHLVLNGEHASYLAAKLEEATIVTSPDLYCSEIANALWKYVRAGQSDLDLATRQFEECTALVDSLVSGRVLALEALAAAAKHQHSVYDMLYAILARRSGATMLTMDRAFALKLQSMEIEVCCPLIQG